MGDVITLESHYIRFTRQLSDDAEYLVTEGASTTQTIMDLYSKMVQQVQAEWQESAASAAEILPPLVPDKVLLTRTDYSVLAHVYLPQGAEPVEFLQDIIFDKGGMSGDFQLLKEKA